MTLFQSSDFDVVTDDSEPHRFYLGHYRGVGIVVWAGLIDEEVLRRAAAVGAREAPKHPGGRSNVGFVLPGTPSPTPGARAMLQHFYSGATGVLCMGVILEGEGFWASAMRATVTNLDLQGGAHKASVKQVESIEALVPWLARTHRERTGEHLREDELAAALHHARYDLARPLLFPAGGVQR